MLNYDSKNQNKPQAAAQVAQLSDHQQQMCGIEDHRESPILPVQRANRTGLPDQLKSGMEALSGRSLDHVRVHYNSSKPAAVQAHAFAQGSEIHLASGQEKHLPHELGHVVQQAEGRVRPTTTVGGIAVNDNPGLEQEATRMGEQALGGSSRPKQEIVQTQNKIFSTSSIGNGVKIIQRAVPDIQQPNTNLCWATAGYAVYDHHHPGRYATIAAFVAAQGSRQAQADFIGNAQSEVSEVIGMNSRNNLRPTVDNVPPFSIRQIENDLPAHPIVANVGGNHYVVLVECRTTRNGKFRLRIMDPATGRRRWYNSRRQAHARRVQGLQVLNGRAIYSLRVIYCQ